MGLATSILVVDDAVEVRVLVAEAFRDARFEVTLAGSVAEARDALAAAVPDLVVLDIGLPDGDGLELCREIREEHDTYVILLSARTDEIDRVLGLSLGADDYVTKPFFPRELVARAQARLRRPVVASSPDGDAAGVLEHEDLVVDPLGREVRRDDRPVPLTRIEFDLLNALMENPRRVLTRDALLERVWGPGWAGEGRLVEVHVSKLRGKLDDDASRPRYIRTVRGVGYRMATTPG